MTHTKHHLEPIEAIDYLRFIPPKLHQEAIDFVVYAASRPFAKPTDCPHCVSYSFYIHANAKLIEYRCKSCKKTFSSLTGTLFKRFRSHDEWEGVAMAMLAGIYDIKVRRKLGTKHQFICRERALETIMEESFSNLFRWWMLFRYQAGGDYVEMSPQVQVQSKAFQVWLKDLLKPEVVICPRCKGRNCYLNPIRMNQVGYICKECWYLFSLIARTQFKGIHHTSELMVFFNLLLTGACDPDFINRQIEKEKIHMWRNKFMLQLRDLNLDLLADWIEWKRYCRFRQLKKEQSQQ